MVSTSLVHSTRECRWKFGVTSVDTPCPIPSSVTGTRAATWISLRGCYEAQNEANSTGIFQWDFCDSTRLTHTEQKKVSTGLIPELAHLHGAEGVSGRKIRWVPVLSKKKEWESADKDRGIGKRVTLLSGSKLFTSAQFCGQKSIPG